MAAVRALVSSRLAAASAFASLSLGGRTPSQRAALHLSVPRPAARVALVLSGCGVYDGTEIHEASAILVHLSRGGAEVQIFAPDVPQMHVIDHTKGQPSEGESRNVLTESARIARGKITDLANLSAANHDAAIFPGGFGAAKNLSTFAVDGKDCKVNQEVERVLKDFHQAGKPIGLCCIAPVLAAKVLRGVEVTVGHEHEEGGKWPYTGTAEAIKALGAKHCVKEVIISFVDQKNKVVTTPAFMCETALHHIHDGIGAMVRKVLELTGK
ncbi:glutamine amidotransferase-like class 1 domain-containing protein 3, mitochondrial isoform X2 [Hylobates moloch]|uniref:glutamine amidotransferase-like class 1 domain-containing protein 3, mitochondrial isoform X2 n=1 Tax=Hylobates moloch TaxID=81572 RepID=UPI002676CB9A|nr:glutamine amidotransferase-like class 1 domain-containing protein 3, mitochondrial isoform X2 [Hylobates moloch]